MWLWETKVARCMLALAILKWHCHGAMLACTACNHKGIVCRIVSYKSKIKCIQVDSWLDLQLPIDS